MTNIEVHKDLDAFLADHEDSSHIEVWTEGGGNYFYGSLVRRLNADTVLLDVFMPDFEVMLRFIGRYDAEAGCLRIGFSRDQIRSANAIINGDALSILDDSCRPQSYCIRTGEPILAG